MKRKPISPVSALKAKKAAIATTDDLCKDLVVMAGINFNGRPEQQDKIYRAVRILQSLSALARGETLVLKPSPITPVPTGR